jgi:hypothetical protein
LSATATLRTPCIPPESVENDTLCHGIRHCSVATLYAGDEYACDF